jgi:hypothetical protein
VGVVGGCKGGCGEWVEEGVEEVVWVVGEEAEGGRPKAAVVLLRSLHQGRTGGVRSWHIVYVEIRMSSCSDRNPDNYNSWGFPR